MATPLPVSSGPKSLSDIAGELKLGKVGIKGGTFSVAGAPVPAAALSSGSSGASLSPILDDEEARWTARAKAARDELEAAAAAYSSASNQLPMYIAVSTRRGGAVLINNPARDSALLPYQMRLNEARARVNALPEEARKAGAQPGWVR
jgi:hypothetical protein